MNTLRETYKKEIALKVKKDLNIQNDMAIPNLEKVVVNIGMGESIANPSALEKMAEDLATITGQKPLITKAKKAISNFKLRKGVDIGLKVTLRGERMWDFVEKLISIVLPRVKDFRGINPNAFDGKGNYSLGIREHTVFPEIDPNKVDKMRSFQIIMVTTANSDEAGYSLLKHLGMPFAKKETIREMEHMKESIKREKKEKAKMKEARKSEGANIESVENTEE